MKTMTIEELRKRELQFGDVLYFECQSEDFKGWYLIMKNCLIGLNTPTPIAWRPNCIDEKFITKIILNESIDILSAAYDFSQFMRSFNDSLDSHLITYIVKKKMAKYVHCVHFGSSKFYTWRVPEKLNNVKFKKGDIVEVDTMYGNKYVEVRETAEYEYDEKTKEVINLIKTDDLPF
ncbi:hypothetical protein CIW83_09310 [Tissierella sp. P1]|uniref:DUF5839 family protein n=1 Tax=Tissierella sp. P1 TaxID=1280483 RepID=UPI000B9FEB03|nr:DUF5839 family protein [Tissierella sp. P1]OZV12287.1 hypothetical protein CIW83_09310 [Tissierella sp. P1]